MPQASARKPSSIAWIVGAAASLSLFWALVFYPAVMSWDATEQWSSALEGRYWTWHPPSLALLMGATQRFASTPAPLAFVQGALFWGCLFFLLRRALPSGRGFALGAVVMGFLPPLWLYSNALVSNTWMAACGFVSIAYASAAIEGRDRRAFWLSAAAWSAAIVLRREAVVLLPMFSALHLFCVRPGRGLRMAVQQAALVALLIAPAQAIQNLPMVSRTIHSPAAPSLLNQYLGVVVRARDGFEPADLEAERAEIEGAFGPGSFDALLAAYRCDDGSRMVFSADPVLSELIPTSALPFILRRTASVALRDPLALAAHTACYTAGVLQISGLQYQDWGAVRPGPDMEARRRALGIPFDSKLPGVKVRAASIVRTTAWRMPWRLLYLHYVWLGLGTLVALWGLRRRRPEVYTPMLFALGYVLVFVPFGPASVWRFLLFPYVCAWVTVLSGLHHAAHRGGGLLKGSMGEVEP